MMRIGTTVAYGKSSQNDDDFAGCEGSQFSTEEVPMKRTIVGLMLAVFAVSTGCEKAGTPGGPGATASSKPPMYGQADETFNITTSSVSIKQGDVAQTTVGIKRGTNFTQDVTLMLEGLPKGVTVDPSKPVVESKNTDSKFAITASDEAAIGEYEIKVIGRPSKGADASNSFKLYVSKKDTFTLSVPFWTTALKQGETKGFSISISRDKTFNQDVAVKFEGLPKGITVEPSTGGIKNGETEGKFSLKAADDAPVGDFVVKVMGHPTKGADASHDFKFSVAKK